MENVRLLKAQKDDLSFIYNIYDRIINHLENTHNFTGWKKGIYPTDEVANKAFDNNELFKLVNNENVIIGTTVLNHEQSIYYSDVKWSYQEKNEKEILVVHTLCIDPNYLKLGYAATLMELIKEYAKKINAKAIRLDVSFNNTPGYNLYLKSGYKDVGKVNLHLNRPGFKWWHTMELIL